MRACGSKCVLRSSHSLTEQHLPRIAFAKGGDAVWGNATFAPDDLGEKDHTHGELVAFRKGIATIDAAHTGDADVQNMTANDVSTWILQRTPSYFQVCHPYILLPSLEIDGGGGGIAAHGGNELLVRD